MDINKRINTGRIGLNSDRRYKLPRNLDRNSVGGSFAENLSSGSEVAQTLFNVYRGRVGNFIRNALPPSDENARPGFPGEAHAILRLPNGRFGVANYAGPGTHLKARIVREDPPRTLVDKVSQAHDLRYSLSKELSDIRDADQIMLRKLGEIAKEKTDSRLNILQARTAIKVKVLGEDLGIIKKEQFSGTLGKKLSKTDKKLFKDKLSELEQEGFGMDVVPNSREFERLLPGDRLRMRLLREHMKTIAESQNPLNSESEMKNSVLVEDFVNKTLLPTLLKGINVPTGVVSKKALSGIVKRAVARIPRDSDLEGISTHLTKTLLPLLTTSKLKSLGDKGSRSFKGGSLSSILKSVSDKLFDKMNDAVLKLLKFYIKNSLEKNKMNGFFSGGALRLPGGALALAGGRMSGGKVKDFFKGFFRGFKKVLKPIAQIAGPLLSTIAPEIGVPLTVVGKLL